MPKFWAQSYKNLCSGTIVLSLILPLCVLLGKDVINNQYFKYGISPLSYYISFIILICFGLLNIILYIVNYRILINNKQIVFNIKKFILGLLPALISFLSCLIITIYC